MITRRTLMEWFWGTGLVGASMCLPHRVKAEAPLKDAQFVQGEGSVTVIWFHEKRDYGLVGWPHYNGRRIRLDGSVIRAAGLRKIDCGDKLIVRWEQKDDEPVVTAVLDWPGKGRFETWRRVGSNRVRRTDALGRDAY